MISQYKKEGNSFAPVYLKILSAGGSKKTEKMLQEYGIDITSEKFWHNGFDYIENQARRLEKTVN